MDIGEIDSFCRSRPVEVVVRPSGSQSELVLHGEYDGVGDFFSIHFSDIEYVDIAGAFVVDGIITDDFRRLCSLESRWQHLVTECSGPAVVFWQSTGQPMPLRRHYVVVCGTFECKPGSQCKK